MCWRESKNCRTSRTCLNLNDYQFKTSRYNRLITINFMETKNQNSSRCIERKTEKNKT